MLLVAALADALAERYPLSDAHWDAPIYLLRARTYLESDVLMGFRDGAFALHDAVMRGVYPTPYWSFMRLGQTVLLGSVVGVVGTDENSIYVVTWLYRVLLAVGLFFSAMLAHVLVRSVRPGSAEADRVCLGAIVSVALYLLSDVASYMSGNLVSEVPAIALIAVSAWTLLKAWATGSRLYAMVSGCAAFLIYMVRMESVWSYASLLVAMAWLVTRNVPRAATGWQSLAISACTAGLLFAAYSWFFFPLTDPRLALRFSEATAKFAAAANPDLADGTNLRSAQQLIAANGLLWIGSLLGLASLRTDRAFQFGAVWFLASLVPVAVALTHATDTQTRVYTTLTPTLILLSTLGWAQFLAGLGGFRQKEKLRAAVLLAACGMLVIVSQPASYGLLRELLGLWRLHYLRQYLAAMPFERIDYKLPELVAIEKSVSGTGGDVLLVASPRMQAADYIMVVQYLLPRQDVRSNAGPDTRGSRAESAAPPVRVRLSTSPDEDIRFLDALAERSSVLLLAKVDERGWVEAFECCGSAQAIAQTPHYFLWEFRRRPT